MFLNKFLVAGSFQWLVKERKCVINQESWTLNFLPILMILKILEKERESVCGICNVYEKQEVVGGDANNSSGKGNLKRLLILGLLDLKIK